MLAFYAMIKGQVNEEKGMSMICGYLKEALSEQDGRGSMTRLTIFICVVAFIGWATYLVIETLTLPDFPIGLATLLVGLYTFNTANINIGAKGHKEDI